MVMKELNFCNPYRLVWQSKVGPLPWLSPATDSAIEALVKRGQKNLMLIPIAFTSDHIETLHELDIEYAKELGEKVGAENILRCAAPNDHPLFIDALVDVVRRHLKKVSEEKQAIPTQYTLRCPMCENPTCGEARAYFKKNAFC
jgi:ferrochelatase